MPDFYPAIVIEKTPVADSQVFIRLESPREVWGRCIYHSQYVDLVLPDVAPWRATIANLPGLQHFEFLVKDVGERSHRISSLEPGDELMISKPMGEGFPILANRRRDIILAASGVAICAMRPLIQEILLMRSDWKRVMLFYGERTADRFAFLEEQELWRIGKIEIFMSASRPAEGTTWKGHTGYVQDYIKDIAPDICNCTAFLAGKSKMVEDTSNTLMRIGLAPNMIYLNT